MERVMLVKQDGETVGAYAGLAEWMASTEFARIAPSEPQNLTFEWVDVPAVNGG